MKLKLYMLMMALFAFCAVSCSDDDEPTPVAEVVAGTYNGTVTLSVMGSDQGSYDTELVIVKESDTTVKLTLVGGDGEGSMVLGDIPVSGVNVTTTDNKIYSLTETAIDTLVGDTRYTGTVSGSIEGNVADVIFSVKPGAMPMSINVAFSGTK